MAIEDRTFELLENLKRIKENTFLSDAHKEQVSLKLELSNVKPKVPFVEIFDEDDYKVVTDYIILKINNPNFLFTKEEYLGTKKFLYVGV